MNNLRYKTLSRIVCTKNKRKNKKMTLIIGMKCKEGVFLVSDRKVVDENNNSSYENKLQTLYGHIVGAAGYSHLFKQFNRKIRGIVNQRTTEIDLMNRKALKELGIVYPKEQKVEEEPKKFQSNDLKNNIENEEQEQENISMPYVYWHEDFIEDCSQLIRKLCCGYDETPKNMLDVLLVVSHEDDIRLHHIDFLGNEEELNYCTIGSGSEFILPFLKKFYDYNKPMEDLIKLAFFCVYYVQELEFDNFVGIEDTSIPDNLLLIKDDKEIKFFEFGSQEQAIKEIKEKVDKFKKLQDELNF